MRTPRQDHLDTYNLGNIRSTPFPNRLLEAATTLPETQLRIVLVVVRWTLGWHGGSRTERKASVSLTYRELLRLIGLRSPTAASRAVGALVSAGILEILTDNGTNLSTAAERRRYPGTLRFRIAPGFVEHA